MQLPITLLVSPKVLRHAQGVRPIASEGLRDLINKLLDIKRSHGSNIEKALYSETFCAEDLINRCLSKRPLVFWNSSDAYLLRDGVTDAEGGFENIGTLSQIPPLILADYQSYDEMQISALIGISVPTHFINNGSRGNKGKQARHGTFEARGIYVGLVGARFEKRNVMEWQHMVITKQQNTKKNGYGANADPTNYRTQMLQAWAEFYGVPKAPTPNGEASFFPSFEEALADRSGRFIPINHRSEFLDSLVYKKRISLVVGPFLQEANERAKKEGKHAYVVAVGLGLGVWKISHHQTRLMLDVYSEYISSHALPYISDINFSYFDDARSDLRCGDARDGEYIYDVSSRRQMRILFSRRNPADEIDDDGSKLLVAMYAW